MTFQASLLLPYNPSLPLLHSPFSTSIMFLHFSHFLLRISCALPPPSLLLPSTLWSLFISLVSAVTPGYVLTCTDLKLETWDEGERVTVLFLGLGDLTRPAIFWFHLPTRPDPGKDVDFLQGSKQQRCRLSQAGSFSSCFHGYLVKQKLDLKAWLSSQYFTGDLILWCLYC